MGLAHSPSVVTDGLVFYYDMGNSQKSWRGAPTTNVIETNLSNYASDNGCTVELLPTTLEGNPVYRVTFPSGTLPRIRTNFSYTSGQQFTGSIYYRVATQGSHTPGLIFRESGFGTTYVSTSLSSQLWTRANITHTFSGSGTSMFLLYQSNSNATTPTIIDFSMPQSELGAFATPFVNGTRSNTQAIRDLTNNNTITATSLTYNNDGTFKFTGATPNYAAISPITLTNSSYSVEAFIKRDSTGSAHGILSDLQFSWWIFYVNSSNKLQMQHQRNTNFTINSVAGSTNIGTDWTHVAAAFDKDVGISVYVNGILDGSNTNTALFDLAAGRGPQFIGLAKTSDANTLSNPFNGTIDNLKVYNRALTAAEVAQNFQALRGRYGL